MTTLVDAGRHVLAIARLALTTSKLPPLAELVLLQGLAHVRIRDAVLAEILGHPSEAAALLEGRPTSMAWMHTQPDQITLQRAHLLLARLNDLGARSEPPVADALYSITALLLWLDHRPVDASIELIKVSPDYPLAIALARSITIGHAP